MAEAKKPTRKNNKDNLNTRWVADTKSKMEFTYNNTTYTLQLNDEVQFRFYNFTGNNEENLAYKGKVIGFGWGHDSPPYYVILNRWKEKEQKWGIGRYSIKIPGCETGRCVCGILEL
jgi:hypothetical protein